MSHEISFTFNGNPLKMIIEDHWTLLHLIREELGYTGTKEGCGSGECGACTVIVDDKAVNSCLYLAAEIDGKRLTTIEGLAAADGTLHPIQKSFVEKGGIQCGFCSPEAIAGNLCRCTGYVQIIDSIKAVSGCGEDEPHVVAFKADEKDRGE
jgi:carbon-monoxide dehydrogenase small subunit